MILNLIPAVVDSCVPVNAALEEWIETVIDACLEIKAEFVKGRINGVAVIVSDDEAEEERVVCIDFEAVGKDWIFTVIGSFVTIGTKMEEERVDRAVNLFIVENVGEERVWTTADNCLTVEDSREGKT